MKKNRIKKKKKKRIAFFKFFAASGPLHLLSYVAGSSPSIKSNITSSKRSPDPSPQVPLSRCT